MKKILSVLPLLLFVVSLEAQTITGLEIGQKAPELSFNSPEGKEIKLSSLKGKVVLIDFWASWCGPCRHENPAVVAAYNEFKNKAGKGFEVYSVSLDKSKDAWIKAIETDKLSWASHVSDLGGWKSNGAQLYSVNSIPANFLIDSKGIIIAKNLRGEQLILTLKGILK